MSIRPFIGRQRGEFSTCCRVYNRYVRYVFLKTAPFWHADLFSTGKKMGWCPYVVKLDVMCCELTPWLEYCS